MRKLLCWLGFHQYNKDSGVGKVVFLTCKYCQDHWFTIRFDEEN